MARIRTIKPEFWEDEKMASLPFGCRLLFIGMWNQADDQGVVRANPKILKAKIFPYDENLRTSEIARWLDTLQASRMLIPVSYQNESYYLIRTFKTHQIIDKRYTRFIVPQEVINKTLSSHSDHIVNTLQEEERETEEEKEILSDESMAKNSPESPHQLTDFQKFHRWMAENAPYCANPRNFTRQLTESQFLKLKEKYTGKQIADIIEQIENRKDLRKRYCDLYRTVNNWLKKEYESK